MITPSQYKRLLELDRDPSSVITDEDRDLLPGIHFCPDWDGLPVFDNSAEVAGCTCERYPGLGAAHE